MNLKELEDYSELCRLTRHSRVLERLWNYFKQSLAELIEFTKDSDESNGEGNSRRISTGEPENDRYFKVIMDLSENDCIDKSLLYFQKMVDKLKENIEASTKKKEKIESILKRLNNTMTAVNAAATPVPASSSSKSVRFQSNENSSTTMTVIPTTPTTSTQMGKRTQPVFQVCPPIHFPSTNISTPPPPLTLQNQPSIVLQLTTPTTQSAPPLTPQVKQEPVSSQIASVQPQEIHHTRDVTRLPDFYCRCGLKFKTREVLNEHVLRWSSGVPAKKLRPCPSSNGNISRKAIEDSKFPCAICGKIWDRLSLWKHHMRRVHNADLSHDERMQCRKCLQVFENRKLYTSHVPKQSGKGTTAANKSKQAAKTRVSTKKQALSEAINYAASISNLPPSSLENDGTTTTVVEDQPQADMSASNVRPLFCKFCDKTFWTDHKLAEHQAFCHASGNQDGVLNVDDQNDDHQVPQQQELERETGSSN